MPSTASRGMSAFLCDDDISAHPCPGVWRCTLPPTTRRYFQSQGLFDVPTRITLVVAPINVFLNWFFGEHPCISLLNTLITCLVINSQQSTPSASPSPVHHSLLPFPSTSYQPAPSFMDTSSPRARPGLPSPANHWTQPRVKYGGDGGSLPGWDCGGGADCE
jgi:hypothetical protein